MIPQYFIPLMTPDRRILSVVAISLTTFAGTETAVTGTNGIVYPLTRITYTPNRSYQAQIPANVWNSPATYVPTQMDFMATQITLTQYRQQNWGDMSRLLNVITYNPPWYAGVYQQQNVNGVTAADLSYFLMGGEKTALFSPSNPSAPSGSNVTQNWYANSPFTNASSAQFIDIPWESLSGLTLPQNLASATIGNLSADPSSGTALKAVMVTPVNVVNATAAYSTMRIVKITSGAVPTGTYTWPVTLTDVYGQTSTFNVSIVVS